VTEGQTVAYSALSIYWSALIGVGELAHALLSFKRPLLIVDVMAGIYDSVERYAV